MSHLFMNDELFEYIDKNCIFRCAPGDTLFANVPGKKNTWQTMLRRLTHNPKMLSNACILLGKKIAADMIGKDYQFCGLETSSIPLITGLQMELWNHYNVPVNAFTVRKDRKHYGLFNLIEGIPNDKPVVFVDDTFNSGASFNRTMISVQKELHLDVSTHAYCILDLGARGNKKVIRWDDVENQIVKEIELKFLFNINEFNTKYDETKAWLPKDCETLWKKAKYNQ